MKIPNSWLDEELCDNYVARTSDYPLCSRPATHVVKLAGVPMERLCTQHANKVIRRGLAPDMTVERISQE